MVAAVPPSLMSMGRKLPCWPVRLGMMNLEESEMARKSEVKPRLTADMRSLLVDLCRAEADRLAADHRGQSVPDQYLRPHIMKRKELVERCAQWIKGE